MNYSPPFWVSVPIFFISITQPDLSSVFLRCKFATKIVSTSFQSRGRIEIIYDIINSARPEACVKNILMRKSKLPYHTLREYLKFVLSFGLLEERIIHESRFYFVTNKGYGFLRSCEQLHDLIYLNQNETQALAENAKLFPGHSFPVRG
jgi:predicted transcriptional regulator